MSKYSDRYRGSGNHLLDSLQTRPPAAVQQISRDLIDAMRRNPHLRTYVDKEGGKLGIPSFYKSLSRDMRTWESPHLIYPVGDPIFIHIFPDKNVKTRKVYRVVEPKLPGVRTDLLQKVEARIVAQIDERLEVDTQEEKLQILLELLNRVAYVKGSKDTGGPVSSGGFKLFPFLGSKGPSRISLTTFEYQVVKYLLHKNRIGLGVLEPLIRDPYIEDISCDGVGPIFLEHKIFQSLACDFGFDTKESLNEFALWLSERSGKQATHRNPIVDTILSDGSRLNLVYGEDVSMKGTNFTIRKFTAAPLPVSKLIQFGTMDPMLAAYMWMLLREGMNIFVCGETASGKTTTLTALTSFIKPNSKIVSIEDTPEVQLPHENWIREVTRSSQREESTVGMFDLLKSALRQRPNYIIVGEIRGVEGNIAFQAMMTGHPVLSTFHSASVQKTIQRLTGHPILVPKTHITNLNAILIQNAIYDATGHMKRRVTSVNEIVGYNPNTDSFSFIEAFHWEPGEDKFFFRAEGNSYLLEEKIGRARGYSSRDISVIYDELNSRAAFIKKLTNENVSDFREFFLKSIDADKKLTMIKS
ncbi:MAG TPA: type II/IV secretion system ATPase subunit [Candidatus Acidoferrales bacterium]|nr:type II/IV secretion system ATPase subunit [Candidatus Acidoferrales bacterium]